MKEYITESPAETIKLAKCVAKAVQPGTVLCLKGDLGAGKTLFTQGLLRELGVDRDVTSPTFNLLNIYTGLVPIYHFDLYRLETADELYDTGFYEYVDDPDGLSVIEWPDKFPDEMPADRVCISIERIDGQDNKRKLTFSGYGEQERTCREMEKLADTCD